MQSDYSLHLDLYNFEEPGAEKSRYILTSPRSLEACSRFGIQPIELLAKPLSDFQDDGFGDFQSYAYQDHALEQYQQYERQRLRKLRLCREERERIIYEQTQSDISSPGRLSSVPQSSSSSYHSDHRSFNNSMGETVYNSHSRPGDGKTASPSRHYQSNTNWSSGYVSGLVHNLMQRTYGEASANLTRSDDFRPSSPTDSIKSSPVKGRDAPRNSKETKSYRRYQTEDEGSRSDNELSLRRRSSSRDSNLDGSLTSLATMLPSHLAKSLDRLSEKDEKLLRVLLNKAEEEKLDREQKLYSELGRMEEKRVFAELRDMKERQHRMLLADKIRERDYQRELMKRKQKLKEESDREYRAAMIRRKEEVWSQEYKRQADAKNTRATIRRLEDQDKKDSQEFNLARSEFEREARLGMIHSVSVDRLKEADRTREARISQERMKKQYQNDQEKQRYELRKDYIERQLREEEAYLRSAIQDKHTQAEVNASLQQKQKEMEVLQNRMRQQVKKEQQEYHLRKMEKDVAVWKEELKQLQDINQDRARRQARRVIEEKGQRAYEQRRIKEQDHAANLARVEREQQYKRQEIKEMIHVKDRKSQNIIVNKEMSVRESREAARASRALRDAIREQTIKSSFDKMAEEAQRLARMEKVRGGHISGNKSSLSFG